MRSSCNKFLKKEKTARSFKDARSLLISKAAAGFPGGGILNTFTQQQ